MATIKYQLQSKKENAPIYLRLSINRNLVLRRKTGLFINFNDWSETTSLPKQTSASNKNISS
ncbi:MAG: integrase, partial [Gelidibacter sp.]